MYFFTFYILPSTPKVYQCLVYNRRFTIHSRNIHLPASQRKTQVVCECASSHCNLIYVNSCCVPENKKACLDSSSNNTGQYKHFLDGSPTHVHTGNLAHLTWTLVDHIDTSEGRLASAGHQEGTKCRCEECLRLKSTEDKWICRLAPVD